MGVSLPFILRLRSGGMVVFYCHLSFDFAQDERWYFIAIYPLTLLRRNGGVLLPFILRLRSGRTVGVSFPFILRFLSRRMEMTLPPFVLSPVLSLPKGCRRIASTHYPGPIEILLSSLLALRLLSFSCSSP